MSAEASDAADSDDPVSYFVQDMTLHGRSERTKAAYERVLRSFETFLETRGTSLTDAGRRACMTWVHSLRDRHADSTVATYAAYVHRFYEYMRQVGVFDANPMALVTEEMGESIDTDPTRDLGPGNAIVRLGALTPAGAGARRNAPEDGDAGRRVL